jgi:hypothetical protein
MEKAMLKDLSEQERACLEHLRQAQELGLTFSKYCRERDLRIHQWYWIKRALTRKGVIAGRRKAEAKPTAGFVAVRVGA